MGFIKVIAVVSILVGTVSVLLSLDCMSEYRVQIAQTDIGAHMIDHLPDSLQKYFVSDIKSGQSKKNEKVLTKEELKHYDGSEGSKGLYLAVLGKVFDVSRGKKHYGPGGGYAFFAGKDGSRAFTTGEFNEKGLTDDVSGLANSQILDLVHWMEFYQKDYKYIGLLEGNFYDKDGNPTTAQHDLDQQIAEAKKEKASEADDRQRFPPCNSEWNQVSGGRVWCSNRSGGIERDWVGVPRRYHKPNSSVRCACIRTSGPPTGQPDSKETRGDLDNPHFKQYKECPPLSESCKLVDD